MKFIFSFLFVLSNIIISQTGIYVPSMQSSDNLIKTFLSKHKIQGATFAIAKQGKLVYHRAFGNADKNASEATQPYHMFRIASLSKPITGAAVIKLWEDGLIDLDGKVFGSGGIFENNPFYTNVNITDERIYTITVRNLLEHTAGWNRDLLMDQNPLPPYPYGFQSSDPISFPLHITQKYGIENPVSENALIKFLLEKGLDFDPGKEYNYSNIGFLILGKIIEQVTGMEYEEYVKTNLLNTIGAFDMYLGKNLLVDKMEREVEYINSYTTLSCYGTGEYVPWQYGGWNLEAMDAHGGWIASSRDLLRFVLAVDKFSSKPDILKPASIDTMTRASSKNSFYAKGWQVNQYNNWWHTGSLDGTRSILVRAANEFSWVVLLNDGSEHPSFWNDFDNLVWNCISSTSNYPNFDLFNTPTKNSSNLEISNIDETSVNVSWENGNGTARILICNEATIPNIFPLDGGNYTANSEFGLGTDLGGGNFVVYNGNGNSTTVNKLDANKKYFFRVFEYNKSLQTGDNSLYQLSNYDIDSITISLTDVEEENISNRFYLAQNYPNPFNPTTTISYQIPDQNRNNKPGVTQNGVEESIVQLKIYDVLGNEIAELVSENQKAGNYRYSFDGSGLSSGTYFVQLNAGEYREVIKISLVK